MVHLQEDDEGWNAVQAKISQALEPFAEALGPRTCEHGDWTDCDRCQFLETQPKEGSMPVFSTWVLTYAISDMARRDPIVGQTSNPEALHHEIMGLLHIGLNE